jgi:formylglycine-generating enzyme required for sulfatase activity
LPRGTDPEVSAGGADGVNRGGGLYDFARRCRSAVRFRNKLRDRYFNLGFRVALELSRK